MIRQENSYVGSLSNMWENCDYVRSTETGLLIKYVIKFCDFRGTGGGNTRMLQQYTGHTIQMDINNP